jgi:hypothetical protein
MSDLEELRVIFGIAFALIAGWMMLVAKQNRIISRKKRGKNGKRTAKKYRKK